MSSIGFNRRDHLDGCAFWALVLSCLVLGAWISVIGLHIPGSGSIMQTPPNQGEAFSLVLSNGLMGITQAMGLVALWSKKIQYTRVLLVSLLIFPLTYIVPLVDWLAGHPSGIARDIEDVLRFGALLVLGILLLLPWVFRQMRWPHRSAGHMSIGISLLSVLILQSVFHIGLIWSGWGFRDATIAQTRAVIEATASPSELKRLGELGILPLERVDASNQRNLFARERTEDAEEKSGGLMKLWADAPETLFVWPVHGSSERDTFFIVYDGREAPETWMIRTSFFNERRLYSVATMFYLTGFSMAVWNIMALLVVRGHARKRAAPSTEDPNKNTGARRARMALMSIGVLGIASTLVVSRLDLAVASYLLIIASAAAFLAGALDTMWGKSR